MSSNLRSIVPDLPDHFSRDRNCQAIILGRCLARGGGSLMADIRVFQLELSAQERLIDLESVFAKLITTL